MKPNSSMVTAASRAVEHYDANIEARELAEAWMVRFARTIHTDKRWSTIQRVNAWFVANEDLRETDGFFATGDSFTPERLAWDLLGGDAGVQWAAQSLGDAGSHADTPKMFAGNWREAAAVLQERDPEQWPVPIPAPAESVYGDMPMEADTGTLAAPLTEGDFANVETFNAFDGLAPHWAGVLTLEDTKTSDNRLIRSGALTWRDLPIVLQDQLLSQPGHDGAVAAGPITNIFRDGNLIMGEGFFDSGEDGQNAQRRMSEGTKQGVSVDLTEVEVFLPEDEEELMEILFGGGLLEIMSARIGAATLVSIPAFEDARLQIVGDMTTVDRGALVASGGKLEGLTLTVVVPIELEALTASAGDNDDGQMRWSAVSHLADETLTASGGSGELKPPREWFDQHEYTELTPFTIEDPNEHGLRRIHGHVAARGSCHIGFSGRCVDVPMGLDYDSFQGPKVPNEVVCANGERIKAGPVVMDTVHPKLKKVASDSYAHYAHTGAMPAQVRAYEDDHGLAIEGWIMPGTTEEDIVKLNAADLSPDWRPRATAAGGRGVVAILAVGVSGFNLGLVASGGAPASLDDGVTPIDEMAIVGTNWAPRLAAEAQRKIDALTRIGRSVPPELERFATMDEDPALTARKAKVAARFTDTPCDCDCGGVCTVSG